MLFKRVVSSNKNMTQGAVPAHSPAPMNKTIEYVMAGGSHLDYLRPALHGFDCEGSPENVTRMLKQLREDPEALERRYCLPKPFQSTTNICGCIPDYDRYIGYNYHPPLYHACWLGHVECVKLLLAEGSTTLFADGFVNARIETIHKSCTTCNDRFLEILQILIQYGLEINEKLIVIKPNKLPENMRGLVVKLIFPSSTVQLALDSYLPRTGDFSHKILQCLIDNGAAFESMAISPRGKLNPLSDVSNDPPPFCHGRLNVEHYLLYKITDTEESQKIIFLLKRGVIYNFNISRPFGEVFFSLARFPLAFYVLQDVAVALQYKDRSNEPHALNREQVIMAWIDCMDVLELLHPFGDCKLYESVSYQERYVSAESQFLYWWQDDRYNSQSNHRSVCNLLNTELPNYGENILELLGRRTSEIQELTPVYERLRKLADPRSLQSICRLSIQKALGPFQYWKKIDRLPLPEKLKRYLKFDDVPDSPE